MTSPCAIFDLDGTLAHTAPDLIGAVNDLLSDRDFPSLPLSVAETTAGFGGKALIRAAFSHAGQRADENEVDALYHPFLDRYATRVADESHLYDGVIDTLDTLVTRGWIIGVCTNKPEGLARSLLTELDVLHRFRALIGADTLPVRKPDPVALTTTIERCGARLDSSIMIGDTDTDLNTARNAGIPCILTRFGYSETDVETMGAAAVIDTFPAVIDALEGLQARGA
jgi:phosphoglycolate phosphatase